MSISRYSLVVIAVWFDNIFGFISSKPMSQHMFAKVITAHKSLCTDKTFKPLLSCNTTVVCENVLNPSSKICKFVLLVGYHVHYKVISLY